MPPIRQKNGIPAAMIGKFPDASPCVRHRLNSGKPADENLAVSIPAGAHRPERIAERLHGPSRSIDLLQPGVGKETDEPAVRRPERIRGAIGSRQRVRSERVELPNPDLLLSLRDQNHRNGAAVGRNRERPHARVLGKQHAHARHLSRRIRCAEIQGGERHQQQRDESNSAGKQRVPGPRGSSDGDGRGRLQFPLQVSGGLPALIRILFQASRDHAIERRRQRVGLSLSACLWPFRAASVPGRRCRSARRTFFLPVAPGPYTRAFP